MILQRHQQGFSLIELMIAMVVLAVGVLATMAMQFTALEGYSTAREGTGAVEVARSVEQLIRAEGTRWDSNQAPTASGVSAVRDGFDRGFLDQALGNQNRWEEAPMNQPVTQRLNDPETTADDGPARYCVYLNGRSFAGQDYPDYAQVRVAVVYPRHTEQFNQGCGDSDVVDNLGRSNLPELELAGYRAVYFQVGVSSRNLQSQGGNI